MPILKRIFGWVVFIPALLSTLVSLLGFVYQHSEKSRGIQRRDAGFCPTSWSTMVRFNTPFLKYFSGTTHPYRTWIRALFSGANLMFIIIYFLIFVGLALQTSGARMSRQVKFIREGLEDQMILEQAKGSEGHTRAQLEERVTLPHHTILLQYFPLYILPVVIAVVAYFVLKLLGQMAGVA
ncbi:Uncharacterised protein [Serratia fonticola]|uniref:YniB-like protein n=1 Tax=Serratia fonticola TaxID=47917 RepID=A0A4U9WHI9_SERFO|nr:Uncharacterised protein [Serratia fonticola]